MQRLGKYCTPYSIFLKSLEFKGFINFVCISSIMGEGHIREGQRQKNRQIHRSQVPF